MKEDAGFLLWQDTVDVAVHGDIVADTLLGLSSYPKYLLPKYLYDDKGSAIFRDITGMPEYYLTKCETEILTEFGSEIAGKLAEGSGFLNLIEPGSGDGTKIISLLMSLYSAGRKFRFIPVDINHEANQLLRLFITAELPGLEVTPHTGDYMTMLDGIYPREGTRNAILFLGSNIGNLNETEINRFLGRISDFSRSGDMILIGFDLKKSPEILMKAYDDPYGLTAKFNLNHLERLNRELDADFDITLFEHHTDYDPVSGELKSWLVSVVEQTIHSGTLGESFHFGKWEPVFMELSRKFDFRMIETLAAAHGFRIERNFTDRRGWFADSLWTRI